MRITTSLSLEIIWEPEENSIVYVQNANHASHITYNSSSTCWKAHFRGANTEITDEISFLWLETVLRRTSIFFIIVFFAVLFILDVDCNLAISWNIVLDFSACAYVDMIHSFPPVLTPHTSWPVVSWVLFSESGVKMVFLVFQVPRQYSTLEVTTRSCRSIW